MCAAASFVCVKGSCLCCVGFGRKWNSTGKDNVVLRCVAANWCHLIPCLEYLYVRFNMYVCMVLLRLRLALCVSSKLSHTTFTDSVSGASGCGVWVTAPRSVEMWRHWWAREASKGKDFIARTIRKVLFYRKQPLPPTLSKSKKASRNSLDDVCG